MKSRVIVVGFVIMVVILACTSGPAMPGRLSDLIPGTSTPATAARTATQAAARVEIEILNSTREDLTAVYFRSDGSSTWGDNQLSAAGGALAAGEKTGASFPARTGTVRFEFGAGETPYFIEVFGDFSSGGSYQMELEPNYLVSSDNLPYRYMKSHGDL